MLDRVSNIRYTSVIGTNQPPMESDDMIFQMLTLTAVPVLTFVLTVLS